MTRGRSPASTSAKREHDGDRRADCQPHGETVGPAAPCAGRRTLVDDRQRGGRWFGRAVEQQRRPCGGAGRNGAQLDAEELRSTPSVSSSSDRAIEDELLGVGARDPHGDLVAAVQSRHRSEHAEATGRPIDQSPPCVPPGTAPAVDHGRDVEGDPEADPPPGSLDERPDGEHPQQDQERRGNRCGDAGSAVARSSRQHDARCCSGGDEREPHERANGHGSTCGPYPPAPGGCGGGERAGEGVQAGDEVADRCGTCAHRQVRREPSQHDRGGDQRHERSFAPTHRRSAGEQDERGQPQCDRPSGQGADEQTCCDRTDPPAGIDRGRGIGQVGGSGALSSRRVGPEAIGRDGGGPAAEGRLDGRSHQPLVRTVAQPGAQGPSRRERSCAQQ